MKLTSKIKVSFVDFDTDGDRVLNKTLRLQYEGRVYEVEHFPDEDPLDFLADLVSDESGWCVLTVGGEIVE